VIRTIRVLDEEGDTIHQVLPASEKERVRK